MAITYQISVDSIFSAKDKEGNELPNRKPYNFIIKPYQRGYRWEPIHITHLIEDLWTFKPIVNENGNSLNKNYCLQPIIVKEINSDENQWELVDGQQRSISLWLMRRICFWFRQDEEDDDLFYSLTFENKPELQELVDIISERTRTPENPVTFIRKLKEQEENHNTNYLHDYFGMAKGQNIDVDCMIECMRTILLYDKINGVLGDIFYPRSNDDPKSKSILLVWYQLDNTGEVDDAITVFSNINANKIKLTESELIKAQILYNLRGSDRKKEEESEISIRWESIERTLCDDSFWYFLNAGDGKETGTRIDFLFEIWSKNESSELGSADKTGLQNGWEKSDYPLSDLVENTIKRSNNKVDAAKAIWAKICKLLDTLTDWKKDYYFYHMIGLIVAINRIMKKKSAADIIHQCIKEYQLISKSKEDFKYYLKSLIRIHMAEIVNSKKDTNDSSIDVNNFYEFTRIIDSLNYEESKDQNIIKVVLLMYNIASLINAKNEHEKFPFELFFTDKYDIEHVNPQNPEDDKEGALQKWYAAMGKEADYDISKGTEQLLKEAKIIADEYKIHLIGNLVLLDANTNRAYKNKPFFEKRREIINILRTGKRELGKDIDYEKYIPIGTKWVFLKAFSELMNTESASIHLIWDGEDEYKKDLIKQLWLLQSGYKNTSDKVEYYEYKNGEGILCAKGLIIDYDGKYHFIAWDETNTALIKQTGKIEISNKNSNGLLPDGTYLFFPDGTYNKLEKN